MRINGLVMSCCHLNRRRALFTLSIRKKTHVFELLRTHNSDGCLLVPQIFRYEVDWDTSSEQC